MADRRQYQSAVQAPTRLSHHPQATTVETAGLRPTGETLQTGLGNQALGRLIAAGGPSDHHPAALLPDIQASREGPDRPPWFHGLSQDLRASQSNGWVQAKLTLGSSTSHHEQEADRMATRVVKQIHSNASKSANPVGGGQPAQVIRKVMPSPGARGDNLTLSPQVERAIGQEQGHGEPIAEDVRQPLEQAFNADLRGVRIHASPRADRLSRSMGAIAFTKGRDIFFKQGAYQPKSHRGQELLAHEITHVIQQSGQERLVQRKVGNAPAQNKTESPAQPGSLTGDLLQQTPATAEAARALLNTGLPDLDLGSGLSILQPSFTVTETANDFSIEIGGTAVLDLGSDLDTLKSEGTWKITFESKQKAWTVELLKSSITAQVDQLFVFNAQNLEYTLKDRCLKVPTARVEMPHLNNSTAEAQDITISREGLDWKDLTITTNTIDLGGVLNLKDIKGTLQGKDDDYSFDASGTLGVDIASQGIGEVVASGNVTVGRSKAKVWSYGFEGGSISAKVQDLLTVKATGISYENSSQVLAFASATVTPHVDTSTIEGLTGTVTQGKISGTGFDWQTLQIAAGKVNLLGGKVTGSNLQGTVKGKKDDYSFDASGTLAVDIASQGIGEIEASGTVKVGRSKAAGWSYKVEKGSISANIAELVKLQATEISYDNSSQVLAFGSATVTPELNASALEGLMTIEGLTGKVTQGRISGKGFDWDTLEVSADKLNLLGGKVTGSGLQGTVKGKDDDYSFDASGTLGVDIASQGIGEVVASGNVTVGRSKAKVWSYGFEGGSISAKVQDLLTVKATGISYENSSQVLAFASATVTPHVDTSTIEGLTGTVTQGKISGTGFDWQTLQIAAGKVNLLGGKVTGSNLQGTVKGKKDDYSFDASGTLAVDIASQGIGEIEASGTVKVGRSKAAGWSYKVEKGSISANIAELVKLQATEISYDNSSQVLGIKKSTLSSTALKNTTLTLTEGKVSKDGLDWTKLSVTQKSLDLGGIVKLEDIEGRVKGKGDDYAFDASAGLGLNLSSEDIGSLTVEGKASLGYANKALTYGFEGVSVTGEIPKVLKATATDIHYDQNTKALKVSKVTVKLAIPKLKETSVEATGAKITNKGIDWDQVRVTGPDIPFGDIFKVAKPTVIVDGIVDGAEKNYSIYLEGGATLKFGKYLEGGGTGGIKIDRLYRPRDGDKRLSTGK